MAGHASSLCLPRTFPNTLNHPQDKPGGQTIQVAIYSLDVFFGWALAHHFIFTSCYNFVFDQLVDHVRDSRVGWLDAFAFFGGEDDALDAMDFGG